MITQVLEKVWTEPPSAHEEAATTFSCEVEEDGSLVLSTSSGIPWVSWNYPWQISSDDCIPSEIYTLPMVTQSVCTLSDMIKFVWRTLRDQPTKHPFA